jgi:hypothetical protein
MRKERKEYKVLVGKPKGKRPLERPRRRWEDGIRMVCWNVDKPVPTNRSDAGFRGGIGDIVFPF